MKKVTPTQTNAIETISEVKLSIDDLNRLAQIKLEIDALKSAQTSTLSHLFNRLSELNYDIKGLEMLTNNQKRTLILNEIEINLESEYAISILGLIKWYYASKLSVKKEFITLKNLKTLKKLSKFYTKSSVNALTKITLKEEYAKKLSALMFNAQNVATMIQNIKNSNIETICEVEGVKGVNYDLNIIKIQDVRAFNNACYIETLNKEIQKVS